MEDHETLLFDSPTENHRNLHLRLWTHSWTIIIGCYFEIGYPSQMHRCNWHGKSSIETGVCAVSPSPVFQGAARWPVSLRCTPVVSVISMATVQTASKGMSILEVRNNCPEDWEDWEGIWRNLWLRFKAAVAHLQVLPPPSFSMLWGNVTTNGPSSEPVVPRGGSTFVDR